MEVANRLDPDFVMTVGDLVQGYCAADPWVRQMREYKEEMKSLRAPWYPVVGNHDVYGGRGNRKGNTELFKEHFGPLYYSFDYRWGHFISIFSDESLSFGNPAKNQNVSEEQMAWLREDLKATKAEQVFVFLHHPRWLYRGTNWPKVHEMLEEDGRVRAVFAGHLHQFRDDGIRDGIHYFVLAVTGARQTGLVETGGLHHLHLVKVRRGSFSISVFPLGTVIGSDAVLGRESGIMQALSRGGWLGVRGSIGVAFSGESDSEVRAILTNPTDREAFCELAWSGPKGHLFEPATVAATLAPGERIEEVVRVRGPAFRSVLPAIRVAGTMYFQLRSGLVQPIRLEIPAATRLVGVPEERREAARKNRVVVLDGKSAVRIPMSRTEGPFTLECWVRGPTPKGRQALISRCERSGFGLWWAYDKALRPYGAVGLRTPPGARGPGYVNARATRDRDWGKWTHVALVWDGRVARFFVGGELVSEEKAPGPRQDNALPLLIGADPDAKGGAGHFFTGAVDEVRLSKKARYRGRFKPHRTFRRDADTVVLLHFDRDEEGTEGTFFADDSGRSSHGWPLGAPKVVEEEVRTGR